MGVPKLPAVEYVSQPPTIALLLHDVMVGNLEILQGLTSAFSYSNVIHSTPKHILFASILQYTVMDTLE